MTVENRLPRNRTCRCGGVMTCEWTGESGNRARWYACMRCDTSVTGSGEGPPRFMAIWEARREDLGIRGSEEAGQ